MRIREWFWIEGGDEHGVITLHAPRCAMTLNPDQAEELIGALRQVLRGEIKARHVAVGFKPWKTRGPAVSAKEAQAIWEYHWKVSAMGRGADAMTARKTGFSAPTVRRVVEIFIAERRRMAAVYGMQKVLRDKPPVRPQKYYLADGYGTPFADDSGDGSGSKRNSSRRANH